MNKKRVVLAVLILSAIIIALYGIGHISFRVKESEDTRPGETDIATKESMSENVMPQIVDIIIDEQKATILCEDGSVWRRLGTDDRKDAVKISGLENITKILYGGPAMYALSESGNVYAWGSN